MKWIPLCIVSLIFSVAVSASADSEKYVIDTSHSKIGFEVAHLVIATVEGRFRKVDGSFEYDSKKKSVKNGIITIQAKSIFTDDEKRDKHLRSDDFFNTKKYPEISFKNIRVQYKKGKPDAIQGDLTIRDQTHPLRLKVDFKGAVTDPWGNEKLVFNAEGKIDRRKFGVNWNKTLDRGGVVVGNDVKIKLRVEANKKS